MNEIEKSILNQLWIYSTALKTLYHFKLANRYAKQVDITINNLFITAQMLRMEARREALEIENVSKC